MRITSWTFLFGAQEEMPIVKLMGFSRNVKKKTLNFLIKQLDN